MTDWLVVAAAMELSTNDDGEVDRMAKGTREALKM